MRELIGSQIEKNASSGSGVLVDRSDIQEELVRFNQHVEHFSLAGSGRRSRQENGFSVQEMNREANTLLSKTSGWPVKP
jgi:uncharacterized protein YicC (UPF0701 family)